MKTRHYSRPPAWRPVWLLLCLLLWLLPGLGAGQSTEQSERELAEIRARIEALTQQQAERSRQRDQTAAALQQAEASLADARRALDRTDEDLALASAEQQAVQRQLDEAVAAADDTRELLAEQVRLTYYAGRQEVLRLLLNQEDPALVGRMLAYYDYLNRHRSERLQELGEQVDELERLNEEARVASQRLAQLQQQQRAELEQLNAAQAQRQAALQRIESELAAGGGELNALRTQEAELDELIEQLRRELANFPSDPQTPFVDLRGQLAWPVQGSLLHTFGEPRAGAGVVRWNGLLFAAPRGSEVRAVHQGQVIYADWLTGYGLLLIIDHGQGYWSVYGHNETLYHQLLDWVAPGQVVALVGDSGGQSQTGLYFEIRHNGASIDPASWLAPR